MHSWVYKRLVRALLFQFDAEAVHHWVMAGLGVGLGSPIIRRLARRYYRVQSDQLHQQFWGLDFVNPVGLAAGFDKNAQYVNVLDALGFGWVEVGTLTGRRQPGNERPRLFRLPADRGLINRMGFNNHGSKAVASRLAQTSVEPVLGVNIGKSKVVDLQDAPGDYEASFRALYDAAGYFAVNVSSPNTPGLRKLQHKGPLAELLGHLQSVNDRCAAERRSRRRPVLVKISPDITDGQLDDILEVVDDCHIDGIIATNTTVRRGGLETPGQQLLGPGGVSGRPVHRRSCQLIARIYRLTAGELPIVGVGGIFGVEDALETIRAGASLVQIWTGFVYQGPTVARTINRGLIRACQAQGWAHISEAVGVDAST